MDKKKIDSPCNNICKMDNENKYCVGCYRTLDEIAQWQSMTEIQKKRVYELIELRKKKLFKLKLNNL